MLGGLGGRLESALAPAPARQKTRFPSREALKLENPYIGKDLKGKMFVVGLNGSRTGKVECQLSNKEDYTDVMLYILLKRYKINFRPSPLMPKLSGNVA